MQCITELISIWPVPGALAVFVRKFVDDELGIVVGIAYWSAKRSSIICISANIPNTGSHTLFPMPI